LIPPDRLWGDTLSVAEFYEEPRVLALDFGGSKTAVAVCSLAASRVADAVVEVTPSDTAERIFERALAEAMRLLDGSPVAGVGACTFGIPRDDGVALSPAIPGWHVLPLRHLLEEAFRAPVVLETDVKAAAMAEAAHGALAGADPAIYVNLGTGLAAAVVVDGVVLRGAHGASGEIGYNLPGRWAAPPDGAPNGDARAPVVEDLVSGMGLARALAPPDEDGGDNVAVPDASAEEGSQGALPGRMRRAGEGRRVAELFETTDAAPEHRAIIEEFIDELSFQLVNLAIAIDPARIAVGGGMVRSWPHMEGPLRKALLAHVPYPPELVEGRYPFDAALRGAIDLGVALATSRGGATGSRGSSDVQPSAKHQARRVSP
jgi:glucokinase